MNMHGNTSIKDDIKHAFSSGNVIVQLIVLNIAVFLLINVVFVALIMVNSDRAVPETLKQSVLTWIELPATFRELLWKPWTLITHLFTHVGIFHILFNMLCLYWFGNIIREFIGHKKILPMFILGGFSGALLMLVFNAVFPGLHPAPAMGASAGVLAIIVGAAALVPDYTLFLLFFGAVRLKYIALFIIILDFVSIPGRNAGGHIAHLGGALFGYLFIRQLQMGHDWSLPFNSFFERIKNIFTARKEPRVVYKTKNEAKRKPRADFPENKQQQVDAILDKIAQSGYDSLTKEEKEFLFRASKEE